MSEPQWRRSSACRDGLCMEIAATPDGVIVRASTAPDVVVELTKAEFGAWLIGAKAGEFDDLA